MARQRHYPVHDRLHKPAIEREFEERYGANRGEKVYGAVAGEIHRGEVPGYVRNPHRTKFGSSGVPRRRKSAGVGYYFTAHRHKRGHHGGSCDGACRRGIRPHKHRSGSSRRG